LKTTALFSAIALLAFVSGCRTVSPASVTKWDDAQGGAPLAVIVMGVSGSGKSTVGKMLAERLGEPFLEGDDFHPEANKKKMHDGIPLTDEDRWPWLDSVRDAIAASSAEGHRPVVACSALKESYRARLRGSGVPTRFVYLRGTRATLLARLESRKGHFFNPALLDSQLATLEEPKDALTLDIELEPKAMVEEILKADWLAR
jgi:gluconokinase